MFFFPRRHKRYEPLIACGCRWSDECACGHNYEGQQREFIKSGKLVACDIYISRGFLAPSKENSKSVCVMTWDLSLLHM
jgi:hypothetical protein